MRLLLIGLLFLSCNKQTASVATREEILYDHLTGKAGNKKWNLHRLYVNGTEVPLSDHQKGYYKTFTKTATPFIASFFDDDGHRGTAFLVTALQLKEIIESGPALPLIRNYVIRDLQEKQLDVELTTSAPGAPVRIIREVYNAN